MSAPTKSELAEFHRYVGRHLDNGGSQLTPEEVLVLWREQAATIAAVRESLDDLEAGRVSPAAEVIDELRNSPLPSKAS
jgi:hypothetical protein